MNKDSISSFWSKVDKQGDGCWIWKASKRNKGYGAFVWADENGKIIQGRAHRFMYELKNGKIPNGLCVLHQCDNPSCVNPSHLFLGTKNENNLDMVKKGRHRHGTSKTPVHLCKYKRGKHHWNYKFKDAVIEKIRKARVSGMSYPKLSKKFCINIAYVWRLCNREARNGTVA